MSKRRYRGLPRPLPSIHHSPRPSFFLFSRHNSLSSPADRFPPASSPLRSRTRRVPLAVFTVTPLLSLLYRVTSLFYWVTYLLYLVTSLVYLVAFHLSLVTSVLSKVTSLLSKVTSLLSRVSTLHWSHNSCSLSPFPPIRSLPHQHVPPIFCFTGHVPPIFSLDSHVPPILSLSSHVPPIFSLASHAPPIFSLTGHVPPPHVHPRRGVADGEA
jgi:hypothetical protein